MRHTGCFSLRAATPMESDPDTQWPRTFSASRKNASQGTHPSLLPPPALTPQLATAGAMPGVDFSRVGLLLLRPSLPLLHSWPAVAVSQLTAVPGTRNRIRVRVRLCGSRHCCLCSDMPQEAVVTTTLSAGKGKATRECSDTALRSKVILAPAARVELGRRTQQPPLQTCAGSHPGAAPLSQRAPILLPGHMEKYMFNIKSHFGDH